MKILIKDIANALKVSKKCVSLVLNKRGDENKISNKLKREFWNMQKNIIMFQIHLRED